MSIVISANSSSLLTKINKLSFRKLWASVMKLRKAKRSGVATKTLFSPDSSDVDAAYQDFCNVIRKAAKKFIPSGRRNNRIPCWDAECKTLYTTFLLKGREFGCYNFTGQT